METSNERVRYWQTSEATPGDSAEYARLTKVAGDMEELLFLVLMNI